MKLSGILSAEAFKAFQGGFEGRCYAGLRNETTRYVQPAHIRRLRGAGYLQGQLKNKKRHLIEGVVSHFVRIRHADGSESERTYSLVVLFEELNVLGMLAVPSAVFLADESGQDGGDGGDEEDEPSLRNCPVDICFGRGTEKSCETVVNLVPEDEECPDSQSGCPNTACSGGGGGGGVTIGTGTTDIVTTLGG